jgi:hypothetical protein
LENPEREERLSCLKPYTVGILIAVVGCALVAVALGKWSASHRLFWTLLALGIADLAAALASIMMWKQVRRASDHYVISGLFGSERVAFKDVCLVVPGQGLFWECVHIHFNRPNRFGWSVSYVPIRASKSALGPLDVSKTRAERAANEGLMPMSNDLAN